VSVVVGSILLVVGAGTAVGATAVLAADTAGRSADGFVQIPAQTVTGTGHALVFDPFELESDLGAPQLGAIVGDVRIGATAEKDVFVGIGPADAVEGYLASVQRLPRSGHRPQFEQPDAFAAAMRTVLSETR